MCCWLALYILSDIKDASSAVQSFEVIVVVKEGQRRLYRTLSILSSYVGGAPRSQYNRGVMRS